MRLIGKRCVTLLFAFVTLVVCNVSLLAQNKQCPRFAAGSSIVEPKDLFSSEGKLQVSFTYKTELDRYGNTLYCFVTDEGYESPTLHVRPGDQLIIRLKNAVPPSSTKPMAMPGMVVSGPLSGDCGAKTMDSTSVNIHFHGANVPPVCHQDEVIMTTVNSGESFRYDVRFPRDEPPGLYWYHPHIHGLAEPAVLGGASGAIIVDGIQNVNPIVAGLPSRTLIIRDNLVPGNPAPGGAVPAWDVSLNYIPVPYPAFKPVVLPMKPQEQQFWRVLNASADTILDLKLDYDGMLQPLTVVALDGVATGSQDGTREGKAITVKHLLLPPASRAEFMVTAPSSRCKKAILLTDSINTGPFGDNDPRRPLAAIKVSNDAPEPWLRIANFSELAPTERFSGLAEALPAVTRKLYFSEVLSDPSDPASPTNFFITVDGQTPVVFNPANPPAIVTKQGAVEDWVIENRAKENHVFHIHQIHFLTLEKNGQPVDNGQFLDTEQIPFWSGTGPYPSIKVRMDFRGPVVGDFVYHCHILGHEDNGMMATIRVLPR